MLLTALLREAVLNALPQARLGRGFSHVNWCVSRPVQSDLGKGLAQRRAHAVPLDLVLEIV